MAPFEQIAASMGMLHVYDNGRKAYDSPLHALSVQEQLGYVIALHGKDTDSGQNKPLRLWLTEKFLFPEALPLKRSDSGWASSEHGRLKRFNREFASEI